uniref:Zinc finger CCCH domain-containing protein 18 n=1 Tax=Anthurium amnicola TaxID=1678845 RepID=A0A1D1ZAP7_9ARAE
MAEDDGGGHEGAIERQLELQLGEQRESLAALNDALFSDPSNTELLSMCKFFLQQRCRFGSNCRMSHGVELLTSSLKQYVPTIWQQSLVGSSIWAASGSCSATWREAELESWDDKLRLALVVFQDGSCDKLGVESLSLSEYAQMSDEEDEESCLETSDSSEDDEDSEAETAHRGMGFLEATTMQRGVQTETAVFAKWENHTRGIASKMMASMGYREGMGLGVSGQGIVDPIPVKVLPPKQSLDHAIQLNKIEESGGNRGKKRSRGGKRNREKKHAAAVEAAKDDEQPESDVFSFINEQLAGPNGANDVAVKRRISSVVERGCTKKEDRRSLVAHYEKVTELRNKVEKLEEMVNRNRNDKVVFEAASRKLDDTRKALADAKAAHASASNAITSKEKEKRWLKF